MAENAKLIRYFCINIAAIMFLVAGFAVIRHFYKINDLVYADVQCLSNCADKDGKAVPGHATICEWHDIWRNWTVWNDSDYSGGDCTAKNQDCVCTGGKEKDMFGNDKAGWPDGQCECVIMKQPQIPAKKPGPEVSVQRPVCKTGCDLDSNNKVTIDFTGCDSVGKQTSIDCVASLGPNAACLNGSCKCPPSCSKDGCGGGDNGCKGTCPSNCDSATQRCDNYQCVANQPASVLPNSPKNGVSPAQAINIPGCAFDPNVPLNNYICTSKNTIEKCNETTQKFDSYDCGDISPNSDGYIKCQECFSGCPYADKNGVSQILPLNSSVCGSSITDNPVWQNVSYLCDKSGSFPSAKDCLNGSDCKKDSTCNNFDQGCINLTKDIEQIAKYAQEGDIGEDGNNAAVDKNGDCGASSDCTAANRLISDLNARYGQVGSLSLRQNIASKASNYQYAFLFRGDDAGKISCSDRGRSWCSEDVKEAYSCEPSKISGLSGCLVWNWVNGGGQKCRNIINDGKVCKYSKGDQGNDIPLNVCDSISTEGPEMPALSIVGGYDKHNHRFITEPGTYEDGILIDRKSGQEISSSMVENDSLYYRVYGGGTGADKNIVSNQVRIIGDAKGLEDFDKAVGLVHDYLKKPHAAYVAGINESGGSMAPNTNNCLNFSYNEQGILEDNDIDAYAVMLETNGVTFSHAEVAIPVGEVKYQDGNTFPTFAVIDAVTGVINGQLGAAGTQLSVTNSIWKNAVVIKDYVLVTGYIQMPDVKSSNKIYTYTETRSIEVSKDKFIDIEGESDVMATGLPPTNP